MSLSELRNNAVFTRGERVRGRPFAAGNPGRRPGSRNKATLACGGSAGG
jgi:hypothetical protein